MPGGGSFQLDAMRALFGIALVAGGALAARCELLDPSPSPGAVARGTWGGNDAALIVTDSGVHIHVGCTYGNVRGAIVANAAGRFDVAEQHNITAHPVDAGIFLPARLTGRVTFPTATFTVVVDDTVNKRTVTLGPVSVRFGREPQMGPCPICRTPGDQMQRGR
jgi:hypothetical protein